jgi:hypothetical protein
MARESSLYLRPQQAGSGEYARNAEARGSSALDENASNIFLSSRGSQRFDCYRSASKQTVRDDDHLWGLSFIQAPRH